nr:MAG TPA: hypothetical protein [Caudoviricetes sp.]DAP56114.1 MAG TPA: hypothetical protein [Caudoviricetes sp.]
MYIRLLGVHKRPEYTRRSRSTQRALLASITAFGGRR